MIGFGYLGHQEDTSSTLTDTIRPFNGFMIPSRLLLSSPTVSPGQIGHQTHTLGVQ